ncbi:MAG TPA: trypsin-like peptidase domain-containing protein [Gemmatimonadales bacterium]|jgi:S1-C subfamily serine protease|nr:trypsin-like peptidase domain-containing protein [Gemmatimonadales bacterium]
MTSSSPAAGVLSALSDDLSGAVAQAARSVVAVHARRRIPSSGIAWRPGIIVASNGTISREEEITLTLPDGASAAATLAGRDATTDIAVLRTDAELRAVDRGDAATLLAGKLVLAVARPGTSVTASMGVVSAVDGEWRTWHGGRIDRFIRLDISIYDGYSGSALVEAGGRVLGMNSSRLARSLALAIPGSTIDRVVDQVVATGGVTRGYLGIASQPVRLPEALRRTHNLGAGLGLVVVALEPDGPAEQAGVMLGDILVGLDGKPVGDPIELLAALGPERVGRALELRVLRGGQLVGVSITVGRRSEGRR